MTAGQDLGGTNAEAIDARATDTHCHVFTADGAGPTPAVTGAAYRPPQAGVEDYVKHLDAVRCGRGVLVQPSAYGRDHRCLLAALRNRPDRLRGVACVDASWSDADLARMHAAGVRGTRVQDGYPGGVPVESLVEVGRKVAPLGWHVEVWTDVRRHVEWLGDAVRRCPVPVVIDHLGYVPSDAGVDDPAVRLLLELLADGEIWVTLSGLDRLVPGAPSADEPGFAEKWRRHEDAVAQRVRAFAEARPQHLLWGSDWPHVGLRLPAPDSARVRARLDDWIPDAELRRRILVDNAAERYGFDTGLAVL